MPIKHDLWKVGDKPTPLTASNLATEQELEDMIVQDSSILSSEWMLIGRQERTTYGGIIDLLAIAPDASLVLIELKRGRPPREVVAQGLDYASWVESLSSDRIAQIYARFSNGGSLDSAFQERFGAELEDDALNASHQIIIVASELDPATERIIGYLNSRDLAINVVFFRVFEHADEKLLSRAWLIDPGETQENAATTTTKGKGAREPWNGEFYVSFGPPEMRSWDDAVQYGFVDANGGAWYSRTLSQLSPGDRVWVKVPHIGYVGVGRVTEAVCPIDEFKVEADSGERPVIEVVKHAERYRKFLDDPDRTGYFVRIEWLDTVPTSDALNEVGLFGNQNTVCKPTAPKWRHTISRLKQHFPRWDG